MRILHEKSYPEQSSNLNFKNLFFFWKKYECSYLFEIVFCYFGLSFINLLIFRLKNRILHEKSYPKQSPKLNLVKKHFLKISRVGDQNIGSFRCRLGWGTKTSGSFDAVKCSAGPTTCRANYSEPPLEFPNE